MNDMSEPKSGLERALYAQIRMASLPLPLLQFRPIEGRRWACDFAWTLPEHRLIVEVEGGLWQSRSGHRSALGVLRDIEKYNTLTLAGWRVVRVTREMIENGEALALVERALVYDKKGG